MWLSRDRACDDKVDEGAKAWIGFEEAAQAI